MSRNNDLTPLLQRALETGPPPERVERALREAVRRKNRTRLAQRVMLPLAAAAALLLAVAFWPSSVPPVPVATAPIPQSVPVEAVPSTAPTAETKMVASAKPRQPIQRARSRSVKPDVEQPFLAVGAWQSVEPMERGTIVRVQLPRASLATFGVPVRPDRWNETVPADVVLGEDGIMRAVRFVSPMQ